MSKYSRKRLTCAQLNCAAYGWRWRQRISAVAQTAPRFKGPLLASVSSRNYLVFAGTLHRRGRADYNYRLWRQAVRLVLSPSDRCEHMYSSARRASSGHNAAAWRRHAFLHANLMMLQLRSTEPVKCSIHPSHPLWLWSILVDHVSCYRAITDNVRVLRCVSGRAISRLNLMRVAVSSTSGCFGLDTKVRRHPPHLLSFWIYTTIWRWSASRSSGGVPAESPSRARLSGWACCGPWRSLLGRRCGAGSGVHALMVSIRWHDVRADLPAATQSWAEPERTAPSVRQSHRRRRADAFSALWTGWLRARLATALA